MRISAPTSVRRQPRQQRLDEVFLQVPCRAERRRIAAPGLGSCSTVAIASCRPIGQPSVSFVQACALVQCPGAGPAGAPGPRWIPRGPGAGRRSPAWRRSPLATSSASLQRQPHARTDHDMQVRRRVQQQVLQRTAHRRLRQALRVVDHDDGRRAALWRFPTASRSIASTPVALRARRRSLRGRSRASSDCNSPMVNRAGFVLVVRDSQATVAPCSSHRPPPLQQQCRLAEAGRRDDEDDAAIVELVPEPLQSLALRPPRVACAAA